MTHASETEKGTCAVVVNAQGAIQTVCVTDVPMYFYDGEFHPYPKDTKIEIIESKGTDK